MSFSYTVLDSFIIKKEIISKNKLNKQLDGCKISSKY